MKIVHKKSGGCLLKIFFIYGSPNMAFRSVASLAEIVETLKLHNFLENEDKTTNLVSKFSESKYLPI